ncbi:MAG: PfkB family carbohydrate kinase [Chitinophagales bacterium]|nr:hypothetical protein [Bacteroidota bacterium]MCB9044446.1 hypothetical protein [Chitinophagales bacterium]
MASEFEEILGYIQDKNIMVVGDLMIDRYIYGKVNRISPEAPVPIVEIEDTEDRLGGAANVALNLASLGVEPIVISVIGRDTDAYRMLDLLKQNNIRGEGIILSEERKTTLKTRIVSHATQMLRLDEEIITDISDQLETALIDKFVESVEINEPAVVIFQDYNKGVLTPKVIRNLLQVCKELAIPTAVDPKRKNFFAYSDCTLFKPNLKEASEGLNFSINPNDINSLVKAAQLIEEKLYNTQTIITLSELGIFGYENTNSLISPSRIHKVFDVSGAGDTVIAVLGICLALNIDLEIALEIANIAASIVCVKRGVSTVTKHELVMEVEKHLYGSKNNTLLG